MGNGEALFLHGQFRMDNFDQFQDTQTEFADNIEILRGVFINRMVCVFPERDIQMPTHGLHGPMLAHGPAEKRNVRFQTADKVAIFYRHASVLPLQRLLFHANARRVPNIANTFRRGGIRFFELFLPQWENTG